MEPNESLSRLIHDARASLGVIQTTSEIALMGEDVPEDARASFRRIVDQVKEAANILNEMTLQHKNN